MCIYIVTPIQYFSISFILLPMLINCQDRVIFREENVSTIEMQSDDLEPQAIPEKLLIRMKDVRSLSDFINRYVKRDYDLDEPRNRTSISNRRAMSAGRALATAFIDGYCRTELRVEQLELSRNSSVFIWPTCVRLRRCKGCCTSNRLTCRPTVVSIVNVTVPIFTFSPSETLRSFEMSGTHVFSLEQHDRCACHCTEEEKDCTPTVHEYRSLECRCVCKNLDQQVACQGYAKIWNNRNCSCECRYNLTCSTGFYLNSETCRCEEI